MQNQKVLVTGAGGFLGLAITKKLIAQKIYVRSLNRNSYTSLKELGVEEIIGDLQNYNDVKKAVKGMEAVFHVASKTGIWGSYDSYANINIKGTQNIINACKEYGIKNLIYTSTPSVIFNQKDIYNGNETLPYPNKFLCHYASTKAKAEQLIINANSNTLHTIALRPHLIWGPEDTNLIPRLVAKGKAKQLKKVGNGQNLVDIIYVDNAADAHILAWQNLQTSLSGAGKAYFISQGEPVNLWDWIDNLFKQSDIPSIKSKIGFKTAYIVGALIEWIYKLFNKQKEPPMSRFIALQLSKSHFFDITMAKQDLGYNVTISTEEGLKRTVKWIKNNL